MMNDTVRYGIIGFGLFAERAIAPALQASPNSTLVAIQKRSLAAAREKADGLSIQLAFGSAEEVAACPDVDAVFIVSANSAHHLETIASARAGKHVLVEKPMALNTTEAKQMVEECDRNKVKLMVGQVVRFSPVVRRLRELVQSGALGRIVAARSDYVYDARLSKRPWLFDRAVAGGGPIFDVGVHCLDTLCFVLDDHVRSVQCQMTPLLTPSSTEKSAILNLQFSRGTLASIICSFEAPTRRPYIEVMGTEGLAYADDFTLSSCAVTLHIERRTGGSATKKESIRFDVPDLYVKEVTEFSRCILEDSDSPIPGTAGLENQRILDLALKGGGEVSQ